MRDCVYEYFQESTMIKFVMCLTRHPDMTREEFKDYWFNSHGHYFMKNADIMGAKKYVQSMTLDTDLNEGLRASRSMQPEYDGVAEVWFDSEEALVAGMSSPEGQELGAALLEDEGKFLDHAKCSAFIVHEHEYVYPA
jgi:uncharacterized protein (TIGR02118 family)